MTIILPRTDTSTAQLTGGRLVIARVMWVAITAYTLGLNVAIILRFFREQAAGGQYAGALQSLGIAPVVLTIYLVALSIFQSVLFCGLAIFLFSHKSTDPMTIFVSLVLITFGCISASFVANVVTDPLLRSLTGPLVGLGNGIFVAFLYCMPDGKFIPGWLRWPVLAWVIWALVAGFFPTAFFSPNTWPPVVNFLVFLLAYGGTLIVQGRRLRHFNTAQQRQQVKWIMIGLLAALMGGFVLLFWPPFMFPDLNGTGEPGVIFMMVSRLIATLSLVSFPVGLAFSVRRYRLWDVDMMVHRGMVYSGLTVLMVVLFAGSVLLIQLVARHMTGGMQSGIGLLASGIVFGALFSPARRWMRTQVDRHMYGIQVDYHTPARAAAAPVVGRVQNGTKLGVYEVLEPIGRGGMAEVYKGQHSSLGRTVAIKVLPPELAAQADFRKRFEREAHMIASLKHPNIVQLFDFGEADGTYYMVMEYVSGDTL
jgi:MFS family permease